MANANISFSGPVGGKVCTIYNTRSAVIPRVGDWVVLDERDESGAAIQRTRRVENIFHHYVSGGLVVEVRLSA